MFFVNFPAPIFCGIIIIGCMKDILEYSMLIKRSIYVAFNEKRMKQVSSII